MERSGVRKRERERERERARVAAGEGCGGKGGGRRRQRQTEQQRGDGGRRYSQFSRSSDSDSDSTSTDSLSPETRHQLAKSNAQADRRWCANPAAVPICSSFSLTRAATHGSCRLPHRVESCQKSSRLSVSAGCITLLDSVKKPSNRPRIVGGDKHPTDRPTDGQADVMQAAGCRTSSSALVGLCSLFLCSSCLS